MFLCELTKSYFDHRQHQRFCVYEFNLDNRMVCTYGVGIMCGNKYTFIFVVIDVVLL